MRIAGVNVGKVTGIGQVPGCDHDQPGRASCSAAEVTMTIDDGAAAAHRREVRDPPAHVPGGKLLRRRQPGHAGCAEGDRRLHVPRPAGDPAGPARPGVDLAAGRHPSQPPDAAGAVRHSGQAGRSRVQPLDPVLAARLPLQLGRRPRRARDSARTTSRTSSPPREPSPARSTPTLSAWAAWSRTSTPPPTRSRARASPCRTRLRSCPRTLSAAIPAFNALNARCRR